MRFPPQEMHLLVPKKKHCCGICNRANKSLLVESGKTFSNVFFMAKYTFNDGMDRMEKMQELLPPHREHTQKAIRSGLLLLGGGFADKTGSIYIFHGQKDNVKSFVRDDPFTIGGLNIAHKTIVREWNPTCGHKQILEELADPHEQMQKLC